MKKIFKNLLALFVTGTMLAGVGCKDYDDDINKINDRLDELTTGKIADIESQISSMQTTIQNLQALETRIKALEDAQVTDADLQKLQDAIDAIEANYVTKDYLTTTLGSYATTQYVGEAIKAVTDALGKFTTDEAIQAAIDAAKQSAIEAAGKACEEAFKTAVESVIAGATEEPTSEIGKAFKEYDAHIKQLLTDAVEKEDGFINQAIAEQIKAAVDAMSAKLSGRLTSLQVVPDLYVDGIETIELKSFAYKAWGVTSNATTETVKEGTTTTTTAQTSTAVRYLVSPTTVTTEDIQEPSFVFEKAETRSAVKEQLLNVDSYNVKDGVLTVNVKKASGTEITLAKGYIYTAALGVPIAEKWLTDANKPEVVYSDFVALAETTVEPKIAALDADGKYECAYTRSHSHYYGTYKEAQDTVAVKQVAYDDKLDLLTLVTGCYVDAEDNRHEITKDELKAAGLEFRFALPTKPFVKGDNETDQQQFATIAGSTMTSKLPDGTTNNQAAIDKTPVVRVELVDVNNKNAVVDVRYFKIQWVRKTIAPIDLGVIYTFEYTLGCEKFEGAFTWDQMVNEVLAKIGETGMSQDEFLATYTVPKIASKDHTVGAVEKEGETGANTAEFVYNFDDPVDQSAAAFTWRLTIEQVGNVIDKLVAGDEVKYVVNVTIPAQNSYQGSVNFAFEVKVALPELPEIYGYDSAFWFTDYTLAYVYPIQYNTPGAFDTCAYRYELDRLFADSKVVKNMLKCGKWDIQFAKTQPANGYASGAVTVPSADAAGHSLVKGMNTAVQLNYAAGTPWYAGVQAADKTYESAVSDIQVQVINNAEGIGILGQQATLDVWATINDKNTYKVTSFNVYFVEPLNINSELKDAYFVDQVISGSTIDCSKAFTMTDFKDYIVAKTTTGDSEKEKYAADLYIYYGVQAPVWDLANAKTNLKQENGNYVVDETITAETAKILAEDRFGVDCITANADNSTLTFKNVKGVKVEKAVKLFIPVTVKHKWGTLTETVTVDLLPEAPAAE
ncbi:hypothetical protein [uncultured Alistipes sp.]|uniref:hypothetical protein n=1 Tax=uncultured Alistipes sp. TaxID=538949 RepID=UPI0026377D28|nr:hypothetical protein [uncultured Alistipes sp.]